MYSHCGRPVIRFNLPVPPEAGLPAGRATSVPPAVVARMSPAEAQRSPLLTRPRQLRPLSQKTVEDFIGLEKPSAYIEGQYARVSATLRDPHQYPEPLYHLALRIITDGMEHYQRFRDVERILRPYRDTGAPCVRPLELAAPADKAVHPALKAYQGILDNLRLAYRSGDPAQRPRIADARDAMTALSEELQKLAAANVGVPFFDSPSDTLEGRASTPPYDDP